MATLKLFFRSRAEYERAIEFFENESSFYADQTNDEFKCLSFMENEETIDNLEMDLTEELESYQFTGYWFE